jgi:transcriptional regulator with XRE-family HTH domain
MPEADGDPGRVANDIRIRLGRRLRELRSKRGWTQAYLAEVSGLGRSHISELENGRREAELRALEMLSLSFGLSVSELLKGMGEGTVQSVHPKLGQRSVLQNDFSDFKHRVAKVVHERPASCPACDSERVVYEFRFMPSDEERQEIEPYIDFIRFAWNLGCCRPKPGTPRVLEGWSCRQCGESWAEVVFRRHRPN